jgi:hypothetical protein
MRPTDTTPRIPNPLRPQELLRNFAKGPQTPTTDTMEPAKVSEPPAGATLTGHALIVDTDSAMEAFRSAGGTDRELIEWYARGVSPLHLLRSGAQPQMLKASLKTMGPALARQLCAEAGVEGVGPMLLSEQIVEARCDEAYLRMLAGLALEEDDIARADRLGRMADRCSTRMAKALDQLHRIRRPRVSVRIGKASNVNLGEQTVVNESADGGGSSSPGSRNEMGDAG